MPEEESYSKDKLIREDTIYSGLELLKLKSKLSDEKPNEKKHPGYLIDNLITASVVFLVVDSSSVYQNLLLEISNTIVHGKQSLFGFVNNVKEKRVLYIHKNYHEIILLKKIWKRLGSKMPFPDTLFKRFSFIDKPFSIFNLDFSNNATLKGTKLIIVDSYNMATVHSQIATINYLRKQVDEHENCSALIVVKNDTKNSNHKYIISNILKSGLGKCLLIFNQFVGYPSCFLLSKFHAYENRISKTDPTLLSYDNSLEKLSLLDDPILKKILAKNLSENRGSKVDIKKVKKALELNKEGLSNEAIASELNITRYTVGRWMKRFR